MAKAKTDAVAAAGIPSVDTDSILQPLAAKQSELAAKLATVDARIAELVEQTGGRDDGWDDDQAAVMRLLGRDSGDSEAKAAAGHELKELRGQRSTLAGAIELLQRELNAKHDAARRRLAAEHGLPRLRELVQQKAETLRAFLEVSRREKDLRAELDNASLGFPVPPMFSIAVNNEAGFIESVGLWASEMALNGCPVDGFELRPTERGDRVGLALTCCVCGALIAAADKRAAAGDEKPWCSKACLHEARRRAAGPTDGAGDGGLQRILQTAGAM